MVSIVIPTMTPRLVRECIDSIVKYTSLDNVEIIVVANGCPERFKAELDDLMAAIPLIYIWHDKPIGAVPAINAGIKVAKGEFVLLLNDDCAILECPKTTWLTALLEPFSNPAVMATGPFKMKPQLGEAGVVSLSQEDLEYGFLVFFMAMIRKEAFDHVGLLDETLTCGVDIDFCLKLKRKGYLIKQVPENAQMSYADPEHMCGPFPIWHQGEGTVHDFYGKDKWSKLLLKDFEVLEARYGTTKKPEFSIVIPTFGDHLELLARCIDSVVAHTDLSNTEIIISSNGCSQRVQEFLWHRRNITPQIRIKNTIDKLGFPNAINVGVQVARGNIVILLNHDVVILGADWLPMLVSPIMSNPEVGIAGPLRGWSSDISRNFMLFFCVAIRKSLFDQIGYLGAEFTPGGFEDIDFCVKAENAGWLMEQVPNNSTTGGFPIYHEEHHFDWMDTDTFNKNRALLIERYDKNTIKEFDPGIGRVQVPITWPVAQKKYELIMLQDFLSKFRIERVLEVGTYRGGTTMLWAHMVAPHNGIVHCVDLKFDWGAFRDHGYVSPDNKVYRRQVYNDSEFERFVIEHPGDSHDPEHVKKVLEATGLVDFMFIDGDHSYEGVKKDFWAYLPAVKSGGFVAFHDITDTPYHRLYGTNVRPFWLEIKDKFPSWEFIDNNTYPGCPNHSMGIGIIRKP